MQLSKHQGLLALLSFSQTAEKHLIKLEPIAFITSYPLSLTPNPLLSRNIRPRFQVSLNLQILPKNSRKEGCPTGSGVGDVGVGTGESAPRNVSAQDVRYGRTAEAAMLASRGPREGSFFLRQEARPRGVWLMSPEGNGKMTGMFCCLFFQTFCVTQTHTHTHLRLALLNIQEFKHVVFVARRCQGSRLQNPFTA